MEKKERKNHSMTSDTEQGSVPRSLSTKKWTMISEFGRHGRIRVCGGKNDQRKREKRHIYSKKIRPTRKEKTKKC